MVKLSQVRECNSKLNASNSPGVAVFVGGTAGTGKITLAELVRLKTSAKIYVIGRSETAASTSQFLDGLREVNPSANLIFVQAQISLLSEVKRVCEEIRAAESKLDLLFMTPGYAPMGGRNSMWALSSSCHTRLRSDNLFYLDTTEGLEISHALSHYSRTAFILHLLPLLRASGRGRVVSVLGGSLERPGIIVDDLNLDDPKNFGGIQSQIHMVALVSLMMEHLSEAEENASVVFIHSHPGLVPTGNLNRGWSKAGIKEWLIQTVLGTLISVAGFTLQESAERHLYIATSGAFGGQGPVLPGVEGVNSHGTTRGGLYLVSAQCDAIRNEKKMIELRKVAKEKVIKKTEEILRPYM
jgi:NAD(P)-dependent dehydrogenase (short-subunit alcohol dehydrogenase family)